MKMEKKKTSVVCLVKPYSICERVPAVVSRMGAVTWYFMIQDQKVTWTLKSELSLGTTLI